MVGIVGDWRLSPLCFGTFAALYFVIIPAEEEFLQREYPLEYKVYCRNVRRLLPRFRPWAGADRTPFAWRARSRSTTRTAPGGSSTPPRRTAERVSADRNSIRTDRFVASEKGESGHCGLPLPDALSHLGLATRFTTWLGFAPRSKVRRARMSDVFISYARSTAKQAQAVAQTLRGLGRSVWLDEEHPADRGYSEVLEKEFAASKAVLVIWSAEASVSERVRSIAGRAHEDDKLVQMAFDGAPLPLPFSLIPCANIKGRIAEADAPGWRKVSSRIAELCARETGSATDRQDHLPTSEIFGRCAHGHRARLVYFNKSGRHQERYVQMFPLTDVLVYRVTCPVCGQDYTTFDTAVERTDS